VTSVIFRKTLELVGALRVIFLYSLNVTDKAFVRSRFYVNCFRKFDCLYARISVINKSYYVHPEESVYAKFWRN